MAQGLISNFERWNPGESKGLIDPTWPGLVKGSGTMDPNAVWPLVGSAGAMGLYHLGRTAGPPVAQFVKKGAGELIEAAGDVANLGRTLVRKFPYGKRILGDVLKSKALEAQLKKVTDQIKGKEYPHDVGTEDEEYGEWLRPEGIGKVGEAERAEQIHVDQQYSNYPEWNRETKRWEHGGEFKPGWDELDPVLIDIWSWKGLSIDRSFTKQELLDPRVNKGQLTRRQIESMPDTNYMGENDEGDYKWDDEGYLVRETPPSGATGLPFRVGKEYIVRLPDGRVGKMGDAEVRKLLSGKKTTRWKSDAVIEREEVPDNVVLLDDKRKRKELSSENRKRAHKYGAAQFNLIRNKLDAEEELDEVGQRMVNYALFGQEVVDDELEIDGEPAALFMELNPTPTGGLSESIEERVDELFEGLNFLDHDELEQVENDLERIIVHRNLVWEDSKIVPFPMEAEDTEPEDEVVFGTSELLAFPQRRTIRNYEVRTELQKDKTYKVYITNNHTEETKEVPYLPEVMEVLFGDMSQVDMDKLVDVLSKMFSQD